MSLRLKILFASLFGVILSLALLGSFALSTYRNTSVENLEFRLSDTLREVNEVEDSPLQAAFYLSSVANFPLQVGVADSDGKITSLSEIEIPLKRLNPALLEQALIRSIEIESAELLLRTISLTDSGYVVLASSLSEINDTLSDLKRNVFIAALLLILSNVILLHLLTRKDFLRVQRLVRQANDISAGDYKAEITSIDGGSEVAQLSQSIALMTNALQENAENLQILFGTISHELKTPLTAIRGYVELLESSTSLTVDQEKSLDIIQREVERMTALINDLLLLSKLGSLDYDLTNEFDVVAILQERLQILRDLQPERLITVSGEKELNIRASRILWERLIDNLVANLLNHTTSTTSVTFHLSSTEKQWTLTYKDDGPGLPSSYLQGTQIKFQKFDSRKSHGQSTGLGLFIIQSIIEQHHGDMAISSNDGLTMSFTLPKS